MGEPEIETPASAAVVAPPTLASVLQQFGPRFATDAVVPVVLFLVCNTVLGLPYAFGAATGWAVLVILLRRRGGKKSGALAWASLVFVLLRGVAAIATKSDLVYFGPAVANNLLISLAFTGSVIIRRPIVGSIAPIFYPFTDELRAHPAYRRTFSRLTLLWAALQAASGTMQVVLLTTATTNTYLLVRSFVTWPLTLGLFVFSLRYPRKAFAREPDLQEMVAAAESARTPTRRPWRRGGVEAAVPDAAS
jgi:intracellular septation protein A